MTAEDLPSRDVNQAEIARRALAHNLQATNLMAEEIAKAQIALRDTYELLTSIRAGGDDGELTPNDYSDAVYELLVARRALRHLARIVSGHADDLDALATADRVTAAKAGAE